MVGFDQRNPHHCYDVWEHTLHALDAIRPEPLLRWAMLFHDMGKPECFALDRRGVGHFMGHGVVSRRIGRRRDGAPAGLTMRPKSGSASWWSGTTTG